MKGRLMDYSIRCETKDDERIVEEITKKAFWNVHHSGCNEHYLAHLLRKSGDFIPQLDLVITVNGRIIGNIMYTRSHIENKAGQRIETVTFGPVSISPEFQKKGYGRLLIGQSIQMAKDMGFKALIIFGNPHDYCKHGFCGSKKFGIGIPGGKFPSALLVKPLVDGVFPEGFWTFHESPAFDIDESGFEKFDSGFEKMKKEYRHSQEEFAVISRSFVE
jgi:putative acetyltransferase